MGQTEPNGSRVHVDDEPVVRFEGVHKSFGALRVLRGIDMVLRSGETTVIIGESGAGKSVILKHVIGLLRPDRGAVYFHGRRVDRMRQHELDGVRKRCGFLFQLGALFDSLTVAENVGFPVVEHTHRSAAEVAAIVAAKLRMVGLDGIQAQRPAELSGGQKKRVALARAIALDPEIVLYDEPTTGLDPVRADVINELIIKLKRETGVTSIVVTHDMASARKVGDRIIMLHDGEFIHDGTPDDLLSSDDERVQRFVEGRASAKDLASLQTGPRKP